jgi:cation diffusion facilitator CzcD-associated flavoprotein CzcO
MSHNALPIVIIGAGPIGLAAAVHVRTWGFTPHVLEAGTAVGAGIRQWSHVRMFSPWEYNIDRLAGDLLAGHGWNAPDPTHFPTGREVVEQYLEPLAKTPELAPHIQLGAKVTAVTKQRRDRMKDANRETTPFVVRYIDGDGEHEILAQAVIDASGTIDSPNPAGASGLPALGERATASQIAYGMPDVFGTQRARYGGKRVVVVGSGHSAFNVLVDLVRLAREVPGTAIEWAIRRPSLKRVLGGGENDQLLERGRLGLRIAKLVDDGAIRLHTSVHVDRIERSTEGLIVRAGDQVLPPVDEIVVATGFRPDLALLDEIRLELDPGTQSPRALAPLIDPNVHSCGSVRPHGAEELKHPETNLYIVGMKSYGRAPTFLLMTGYEQVRSVAAALAGDWEAARRVELVLPETGVCSTNFAEESTSSCGTSCSTAPTAAVAAGCCGGPAPVEAKACCVADADAKAAGEAGCGCSDPALVTVEVAATASSSCCR